MYIIKLEYVKPINEIEKALNEHIKYLDKYYSSNHFICSGRRNPRVGGIIICNASNIEELEQIISEDPFHINKLAEYEIIEFYPTKYQIDFENFIV